MKRANALLLLSLVSVLLVSVCLPVTSPTTSNLADQRAANTSVLSYTPHGSIEIANDTQLAAMAAAETWPGDGSSDTPFLIQGYEFYDDMVLVAMRDTRLHVNIIDCNFTYALSAVDLWNVTNVVVENCIFTDVYFGVNLNNVTSIGIVHCNITIHPTDGVSGVYMDESHDCFIESCIIEGAPGSDAGIYAQWSTGLTLFNNTVFEFDDHGIFLGACNNADVLNNTLFWNEGSGLGPTCGVYVVECLFTFIYGNYISDNSDNGISISGGSNVTIRENHISENWIHGVYVEFSPYCAIEDNFIEGNGEGTTGGPVCGISAFFAERVQITGNEFWWNAQNSITLSHCDNAYVAGNYLNHSYDHGIWLFWSENATIEENEIYNSYGLGSIPLCGVLVESSNGTSLVNNIIGHSSDNGITVVFSHHGFITGNTVFDSEYYGLFLDVARDWEITHNVIYDNGGPCIVLEEITFDNYVYHNDVGWSGEFLVVDMGFGNNWDYLGVGNWYSDYGGEGPYAILGIAGSTDSFPSISLYSGTTEPLSYEAGTTGNVMGWNASALNPSAYELLIDDESQGLVAWDGESIVANVDGLPAGEHNVTMVVYHISGHWLSNQSTVTVVDTQVPTWTVAPTNQVLEYNEPLSYQLLAADPSGIVWSVNDTANFAISLGGLLTNATFLEPGVYYVEITATDPYAHSISVTLMITVNARAPSGNPMVLALALGGAGAIVAVVVVVYTLKRKKS